MLAMQAATVICASIFLFGLLIWRCWRIFHPRPSRLDYAVVFFGLVFPAMLVLRWAWIAYGNELNPDESQMLAQAMRFLSHPVPWRDVDGTTGGPLDSLILSVPMWCGMPASWETTRLVLLAANCGVVLLMYFSLRSFVTRPEAQFVLMPLIFFYAFTASADFTHYSSETLSSVLLSGCFCLFARQWAAGRNSKPGFFLAGVLLGAIPFAKLQAVPLAVFLGAVALALIFARRHQNEKGRGDWLAEAGALFLGAVIVPAVILGVVAAQGALDDCWKSYILSARKYAGAEQFLSSGRFASAPQLVKRIIYVGYILLYPPNLGMFFLSGMGALAVLAVIWRRKKIPFSGAVRWPLLVVLTYSTLTILCFFTAGKPFAHYGTLMAPPLGLFIGLVFFAGKTLRETGEPAGAGTGPPHGRWLMAFTVLAVGLQIYLPPLRVYKCATSSLMTPETWRPLWVPLARSASRPGDTLSVWGWMSECNVRIGLPPATRDAIGHYVISQGPYQEYYRSRHLRDLQRSKPAIFIDAIGDGAFLCWNQWTAADKHESFPELAKFIDDNYSLLGSYQMRPKVNAGALRVYVLKQRLAELHLQPIDASAPPIVDCPPGDRVDLPRASQSK
jgi:hypothetical protein